MVGVLPFLAVAVVHEKSVEHSHALNRRGSELLKRREAEIDRLKADGILSPSCGEGMLLLSVVGIERVLRIFERLFHEERFLSPYGLRAVSRYHLEHPFELEVGDGSYSIAYEPAESSTNMFGGNSNWRGPIWMPVNFLVIDALGRYARYLGEDVTLEYPIGSGNRLTLTEIAADISRRLIGLFLLDADGRRPCFGANERFHNDPAWRDNILFNEYFHGDNGSGLGAAHQTGWTGLVADLILRTHGRAGPTIGQLIEAASSFAARG